MFWKKDKKDKYKEDPMDVKLEPDEYNERDVGFISMFVPFVRNYATSLAKTHSPAKLPYPVCFYHPRSSLQHQMDLQMKHVDLLVEANLQPHPLNRFLNVLKYSIATCDLPKFPYKPIISQLGETAHYHSYFSGSSDPNDAVSLECLNTGNSLTTASLTTLFLSTSHWWSCQCKAAVIRDYVVQPFGRPTLSENNL